MAEKCIRPLCNVAFTNYYHSILKKTWVFTLKRLKMKNDKQKGDATVL